MKDAPPVWKICPMSYGSNFSPFLLGFKSNPLGFSGKLNERIIALARETLNRVAFEIFTMSIFSHTIRLRLSLQHISELTLLVQSDDLPRVQHLHITLQDKVGYLLDWPIYRKIPSRFTSCPNDLRPSQADQSELRTLHLQNIFMSDVLLLIEHLPSMARSKSLTLIHCDVTDTNQLIIFKYAISRYLLTWRFLRYVLWFPNEIILDRNDSLCWLNLADCAVEEETYDDGKSSRVVLYTVPYPVDCCRQVNNHTFTRRSPVSQMANQLCWTVDQDPLSIDHSVARLQYVRSLQWNYVIQSIDPHPRLSNEQGSLARVLIDSNEEIILWL
ncbi:unnamed protein product [Adineta ricciae]|uniref:Uncharacterized protein n=1 Tax=Adineta ricciae TaxID=249248 RepID=A0A815WRX5_ADIRI|nr:unnamed protein product [Adineta ricciae]CAF1548893.1 unnamed protein product [Adineta ricciae]